MPKNESENVIIPDGEAVPAAGAEAAQAANAWVEFERGRVSRRQALKKLGMTSAMAAFALFSVDDLARMVGKAMQQRAGDNKVAEQVAQEFQQAGIALAYDPNGPCSGCVSGGTCTPGTYQQCQKCCSGCSCEHAVDLSCGDTQFTQAQCRACCKSRNPGWASDPLGIAGYGDCTSAGGCI